MGCSTEVRRNVMGGTNVIVYNDDAPVRYFHNGERVPCAVVSYSSVSAARRAVRTGAALRRAEVSS